MKIVVANWKQNMNLTQHEKWLSEFGKLVEGFSPTDLTVVLCPSHPYLSLVADFAKNYDWLFVGAQDISQYEAGTHTGEVGADQAGDFTKYCIVGHSERGEDDETVQKKIDMAHEQDLIPIVCFVEPDRLNVLKTGEDILLWEDPGNISQGGVFTPKPIEEIAQGVSEIKENFKITGRLIYGGSINRQNAEEMGNITELDGGIAGGASLDPQHFFEIVKTFSKERAKEVSVR